MDVHKGRGASGSEGSSAMNRLGKEHLADVSEEGARVRTRRERLGETVKGLAAEAKVSRNTLAAIEAGESFNRTTLAKIERALDSLEHEAGIDSPPPSRQTGDDATRLVRFHLKNEQGVEVVTAEGPEESLAELEAAALRLYRQMTGGDTPGQS